VNQEPLRIAILGAARIAPWAVVRPARRLPQARVVAVAAREQSRAEAFARRYRIERAHGGYQAALDDPAVDAVYNALPNGLHHEWTLAALAAGKHVLCEKPLTSNASEAESVEAAAAKSRRVVMEAFHYRYHPLAARLREIIAGGELGELTHVEAWLCAPIPPSSDIRYRFDLAGGATMDVGCYAVNLVRLLGGEEPEVTAARALRASADIDRAMTADLRFPGGHTGRIGCSLWSLSLLRSSARAVGTRGRLDVLNPFMPHLFHRLVVRANGKRRVEHLPWAVWRRPTYEYQLEAFCAAVAAPAGVAGVTGVRNNGLSDAIANMRVIDAIYGAAGMRRRGEAWESAKRRMTG
jgi:predicted dehydrogenase